MSQITLRLYKYEENYRKEASLVGKFVVSRGVAFLLHAEAVCRAVYVCFLLIKELFVRSDEERILTQWDDCKVAMDTSLRIFFGRKIPDFHEGEPPFEPTPTKTKELWEDRLSESEQEGFTAAEKPFLPINHHVGLAAANSSSSSSFVLQSAPQELREWSDGNPYSMSSFKEGTFHVAICNYVPPGGATALTQVQPHHIMGALSGEGPSDLGVQALNVTYSAVTQRTTRSSVSCIVIDSSYASTPGGSPFEHVHMPSDDDSGVEIPLHNSAAASPASRGKRELLDEFEPISPNELRDVDAGGVKTPTPSDLAELENS